MAKAKTNDEPRTIPAAKTKQVYFPLGEMRDGTYLPEHVEARLTDPHQRRTLKRLLIGLQAEHAQLASGRHVDNYADVVRYLLEKLGPKLEL